jgi:hypothetical protein
LNIKGRRRMKEHDTLDAATPVTGEPPQKGGRRRRSFTNTNKIDSSPFADRETRRSMIPRSHVSGVADEHDRRGGLKLRGPRRLSCIGHASLRSSYGIVQSHPYQRLWVAKIHAMAPFSCRTPWWARKVAIRRRRGQIAMKTLASVSVAHRPPTATEGTREGFGHNSSAIG